MMVDPHPVFAALARALHAQSRPRVWSLVVTILGDVAYPRGGWMAMADLHQIIEDIGFESGALRTAMSRLSGDGWVERRKEGRNSWYRLGQTHNKEFLVASDAIYCAAGNTDAGPWQLSVLAPGASATADHKGWVLRPGVLLAPARPDGPGASALTVSGSLASVPKWAADVIAPPEHGARLAAFERMLAPLSADQAMALPPREALALRVLMIHEWRRLVLRHAPVPQSLAPKGWPEAECRARVAALYPALFEGSEGRPCKDRFAPSGP